MTRVDFVYLAADPKVEFGRSGGIRTHDPQSPRLMRYQAALRSDRKQGVALNGTPM